MTRAKELWHNLVFLHGHERIPFPVYLFIYFTILTGIVFIILLLGDSQHGITMYQMMLERSDDAGALTWAIMLAGSGLGVLYSIATRKRIVGEILSFVIFGLWFYLAWEFGISGFWDAIVVWGLPNMLFWVWFCFKIGWYRRVYERLDKVTDPC